MEARFPEIFALLDYFLKQVEILVKLCQLNLFFIYISVLNMVL